MQATLLLATSIGPQTARATRGRAERRTARLYETSLGQCPAVLVRRKTTRRSTQCSSAWPTPCGASHRRPLAPRRAIARGARRAISTPTMKWDRCCGRVGEWREQNPKVDGCRHRRGHDSISDWAWSVRGSGYCGTLLAEEGWKLVQGETAARGSCACCARRTVARAIRSGTTKYLPGRAGTGLGRTWSSGRLCTA